MKDRDHFAADPASRKDDQNDQSPVLRTDRVLLTENHQSESESQTSTRQPDGSGANGLTIDQLIDKHSRFLFGYAYRLVGSVSDSEDLTQQTFLIAHQKLDQLRTPSAAKSWLCAILRSCWLKSIRRNQPSLASNLEIELGEFLIEDQHGNHFDAQAIQQALDALPADYRLVLLMYYFEELSYQEIAEKLNVKMGTVMSRLSRAKDRIRQKLSNKDSLLDK